MSTATRRTPLRASAWSIWARTSAIPAWSSGIHPGRGPAPRSPIPVITTSESSGWKPRTCGTIASRSAGDLARRVRGWSWLTLAERPARGSHRRPAGYGGCRPPADANPAPPTSTLPPASPRTAAVPYASLPRGRAAGMMGGCAPTRTILHVDLDAFFAAVEQRAAAARQARRRRRRAAAGRRHRVVRGPDLRGPFRDVDSAPAARTPFLTGRFDAYCEVSGRTRRCCASSSPLVEPPLLDEAFVDLAAGLDDVSWRA